MSLKLKIYNFNTRTNGLPQDQQKQMVKEIIGPINNQVNNFSSFLKLFSFVNQIVEIKKIYEQTRGLAEEVANSVGAYKKLLETGQGTSNESMANVQKSLSNFQVCITN